MNRVNYGETAKLRWEVHPRGLPRWVFKDRYKQECSIQDSSLATEACIWLGVDVDYNGNDAGPRMHLTVDQAAMLIEVLQQFVETGTVSPKNKP